MSDMDNVPVAAQSKVVDDVSELPVTQIADEKLNFVGDSQAITLGTTLGYSSKFQNHYEPDGGNSSATNAFRSNYTFVVPSNQGMTDSNPRLRVSFDVYIYDSQNNGAVAQTDIVNKVAPSTFMVNSMITSSTVKMGDLSRSSSPYQLVNLIARSLDRATLAQISPVFQADNTWEFNTAANGLAKSVLQWGVNDDSIMEARGPGKNYRATLEKVDANTPIPNNNVTPTQDYVKLHIEISEALLARPFQYMMGGNARPFVDHPQLNVNLQMRNNLIDKMFNTSSDWNGDYAFALSDCQIHFDVFTYNTHLNFLKKVPKQIFYNSVDFELHEEPKLDNPITTKGVHTFNNYQLQTCPSWFAVCLVDSQYGEASGTPHRTLAINNIKVQLRSQGSILGELTQDDIFRLSERNGSNSEYASFTNLDVTVGGASKVYGSNGWLLFRLSDLNTPETIQSNSADPISIRVQVAYDEPPTAAMSQGYKAQLFCAYDKIIVNTRGAAIEWREDSASVDPEKVAKPSNYTFSNMNYSKNVLGGRRRKVMQFFKRAFNKAKDLGRKVVDFGKKAKAKFDKVKPALRKARQAVSEYLPDEVNDLAERVGAGLLTSGGSLLTSGGKKLTKAQLMKLRKQLNM